MSNTPANEWAQDLLVGTNNGPWECGPDETAYSVWTKHRHTPIATDVDPGDAQLIAAAPDLAATVASLTEQWGVESRQADEELGWLDWHLTIPWEKNRTRESCEAFIEGRKQNPGFEYRLVRRLVGPTEAVE